MVCVPSLLLMIYITCHNNINPEYAQRTIKCHIGLGGPKPKHANSIIPYLYGHGLLHPLLRYNNRLHEPFITMRCHKCLRFITTNPKSSLHHGQPPCDPFTCLFRSAECWVRYTIEKLHIPLTNCRFHIILPLLHLLLILLDLRGPAVELQEEVHRPEGWWKCIPKYTLQVVNRPTWLDL